MHDPKMNYNKYSGEQMFFISTTKKNNVIYYLLGKIVWNENIIYNFRKNSLALLTIILIKMMEFSQTDVIER